MTCVLVAIMLIDESIMDKTLAAIIAYPTEAIRTQIVEKETIACMGCARLPMARIDVSAMARSARPAKRIYKSGCLHARVAPITPINETLRVEA
jgi:hypothetical protein